MSYKKDRMTIQNRASIIQEANGTQNMTRELDEGKGTIATYKDFIKRQKSELL